MYIRRTIGAIVIKSYRAYKLDTQWYGAQDTYTVVYRGRSATD